MTEKMYLRKKDLVDQLGIARGTISDWINEFSMFMPTIKHGNVTYYRPESIDVLRAIKELKEQGYLFKPDIVPKLMSRGFPITAEEAVEDVQKAFSQPDTRDGVVKVVTELHRQSEALELLTEHAEGLAHRVSDHDERMDGQDGRITETAQQVENLLRTVDEMKRQLAQARDEAAAAKELSNKPWWKKWSSR